jgi:DNA-binding winged helix-turn-helix (wHTH) protein/class 3 adenylate cyclase/tRNA A-37 threonylcarbamoyl transferase component Bud32
LLQGSETIRLSAIVFTDIVGYSALVHRSCELGKRLLDRQRQVVRQYVPAYGGREIQTAGDSFLLEFEGAYAALECVAEIQRNLQKLNAESLPAERVQVRASIHLGDVEHRGAELFGDGVNIAARILPFSPEGGVAFSDIVNRQIHNRVSVGLSSLGVHNLKNIAHPVEIFVMDAAAVTAIPSGLIAGPAQARAVHPALYTTRRGNTDTGDKGGALLHWKFADARFDDRTLELTVGGELVDLERKPLEVLRHLLWHADEVVTKDELLEAVWPGRILSETVLKKAVSRVRAVLKDEKEEIIKTVRGYGYRLIAPVSVEHSGIAASTPKLGLKPDDPVPKRPHWKLLKRLGGGGHGEAWLAQHEKSREKRAYKFALEEAGLLSLKREITISRLLRDTLGDRPDIVRLLDWNLEEEPYFTEAEFVGGGNLQEWMETQGGIAHVPLATRIDLAAQIAETLAIAHSLGVLHKDLKPGNIFIDSADSGKPRAKLADFGSGTVLNMAKLDELGITVLGFTQVANGENTTGTPLYLSPEVLAGQPATMKADIYALGVILFQLVVGNLRKPLAPAWEEEIDDELLREDIAEAAHGNPLQRLADAATLAQRLRSLELRRAERTAEGEARKRAETAQRALERFRARRSGLLAAMIVLIVGLAVSLSLFVQARNARAEAERHAAEAEAASEFLMRDMLSGIDPGQHDIKALAGAKELLDAGVHRIDQRFADQPVLAAKIRHRFVLAYYSLGFIGDGVSLGDQVRAQAQEALSLKRPEALELGILLAADAPNIAVREQDRDYWLALKQLAQGSLPPNDPQLLRIRFALGLLLAGSGDYALAQKELEQVSAAHPARGDIADDHFALEVSGALSSVYAELGELALAESTLRRGLDQVSTTLGPASGAVLSERARLGRLLTDRGQYGEAGQELADALETAQRTRGPGNTVVIELQIAQGLSLAEQGQLEQALHIIEPAVAQYAAGTPDGDEVLLSFQTDLARAEKWAGKLDAAEAHLRGVIEQSTRQSGQDSLDLGLKQLELADVLCAAGKADAARAVMDSLPADMLQKIKASSPSRDEWQRVGGLVDLASGRKSEGIAALGAALDREEQMYGVNHVWLQQARRALSLAEKGV